MPFKNEIFFGLGGSILPPSKPNRVNRGSYLIPMYAQSDGGRGGGNAPYSLNFIVSCEYGACVIFAKM